MLKTLSGFPQDARFIALTQSILGALLRAIALVRLKRQCLHEYIYITEITFKKKIFCFKMAAKTIF